MTYMYNTHTKKTSHDYTATLSKFPQRFQSNYLLCPLNVGLKNYFWRSTSTLQHFVLPVELVRNTRNLGVDNKYAILHGSRNFAVIMLYFSSTVMLTAPVALFFSKFCRQISLRSSDAAAKECTGLGIVVSKWKPYATAAYQALLTPGSHAQRGLL